MGALKAFGRSQAAHLIIGGLFAAAAVLVDALIAATHVIQLPDQWGPAAGAVLVALASQVGTRIGSYLRDRAKAEDAAAASG